jgi:hypothetical protein
MLYQNVYRLQFRVRLLLLRPNEIAMMARSHRKFAAVFYAFIYFSLSLSTCLCVWVAYVGPPPPQPSSDQFYAALKPR